MTVKDRVFLVTGANRGIGAATVRALLNAGAGKIYAAARETGSLPDFGDNRVSALQLDITNSSSVDAAASAAGDVEVLVNNAGTMGFSDFLNSPVDAVAADMNTNYYGTLGVIRAFLPQISERGAGAIVNVISVVGLAPIPPIGAYSASKAALHSLTQTLRGMLEQSGVKVHGVYPGPVDTDLARGMSIGKASPDAVAANIVKGIEEGEAYIFPDDTAQQIGHLWSTNARVAEVAIRSGG